MFLIAFWSFHDVSFCFIYFSLVYLGGYMTFGVSTMTHGVTWYTHKVHHSSTLEHLLYFFCVFGVSTMTHGVPWYIHEVYHRSTLEYL